MTLSGEQSWLLQHGTDKNSMKDAVCQDKKQLPSISQICL